MLQKVNTVLIVVLIAAVGYLAFANSKLQKQVDALSIAGPYTAVPETNNTGNPSPFDAKHTDPLAPNTEAGVAPENTSIKFEQTQFDFGKLNEGQKVRTKFAFTNTGNKPLVIADAQGSCGCTVPEWPRVPIEPGKSANIDVEYNSEGKRGEQLKTITVTANTEPRTTELYVKATVIPKDR